MIMTAEDKYSAVLKELGEVLQSKNTTISLQAWQIDELKAKLAAVEKERDDKMKQLTECAVKLAEAHAALDELKGGA